MSEDESWDIFPPFEAFYLEMLLWHTTTAKVSIDVVGEWMELIKAEDEKALELKKPQLFGHLQNIIQQSGAISRYFWPSKAGKDSIHERRASRLRLGLQVDDNSPLKKRGLRNGLEHFDERLDVYLTRRSCKHLQEWIWNGIIINTLQVITSIEGGTVSMRRTCGHKGLR